MKLKYTLDEKPPIFPLLLYGLQWFLVTIPVVLILGAVVSKMHHLSPELQLLYVRKVFVVMGGGLIIQVLWGHRLPIILGPASVLIAGVMAAQGVDYAAIYTAMMIGGVAMMAFSFGRIFVFIKKVFTPRIVIVILGLIAITLSPVLFQLIFADEANLFFSLIFSLILALCMVIANHYLKGIWKSLLYPGGLLVGTLFLYFTMGLPETIHYEQGGTALSLFIFPVQLNYGVCISFLFCYLALMVNEVGSVQAVGTVIKAEQMLLRMRRGVRVTGALNVLSGACGVVGPVDYSFSPGIISASGNASRFTLVPAGVALILCGIFPQSIAFLSAIPMQVMGAMMLFILASQLSSAFQMVNSTEEVSDFSGAMVVAMPLMIALLISFAPKEMIQQLPPILVPIVGNGFVMGVCAVILLEYIIFRRSKKRARSK